MELEHEKQKENTITEYMEKRAKENLIASLQNYVESLKENINQQEIKLVEHMAIDRITEKIAVCELADGSMIEIPKKEFPYEITSGDIVKVEFSYKQGRQSAMKILEKDEEEKLKRIQAVKEKMNQIKNRLS